MPFDPQMYDRRPLGPQPYKTRGHPLREDDKMGLVLLAVAIVAFGLYTLIVFAGIISGRG